MDILSIFVSFYIGIIVVSVLVLLVSMMIGIFSNKKVPKIVTNVALIVPFGLTFLILIFGTLFRLYHGDY
jgi:hypothetical protein